MRIISGKYKGRHIPVPSGFRARPTTDFARESLFNILANTWDFEGLSVLDLYAGTGSIGLEFASRGSARTDLVELDAKSVRFLQKTLQKLGAGNVHVHRSEVFQFISGCHLNYDIIFADPPYNMESLPEIPDRVFSSGILENEGWLILEHGKYNSFTGHEHFFDLRKYGSVHFSFFS